MSVSREELARKNRRLLIGTLSGVALMIGVAFASVPLYRAICQVTGWGGTTQMVESNPFKPVAGRKITVRFDSNVAHGMPWRFKPDLREVTLPLGGDGFISFVAENPTSQAITGTAVYNVTPLKAGKYFNKTQCFCFGEQVLEPGQKVHMPVVFFVDPAIMDDPELRDLQAITLSYTFFRAETPELERAMEKFYNEQEVPGMPGSPS
jgi:cytochrome c oxidase assembly protein subunit 11